MSTANLTSNPTQARVVEVTGAQVLPASTDPRRTVSAWQAACCADADLRTKSKPHRDLAAALHVERTTND